MDLQKIAQKERKADHKITPLFLARWSPRAMNGEAISDEELMSLFEAARWAPSSYNHQPWRFIYAKKDTKHWDSLYNLLTDWNKQWCKNAAVLIVMLSQKNFEFNGKPNGSHAFSTGSAYENLALEGAARNLVVHGMAGFDSEKARKDLKVPESYTIEAMTAVGKPAPKEVLPVQMHEGEVPSQRKTVKEIIAEGSFKF